MKRIWVMFFIDSTLGTTEQFAYDTGVRRGSPASHAWQGMAKPFQATEQPQWTFQ